MYFRESKNVAIEMTLNQGRLVHEENPYRKVIFTSWVHMARQAPHEDDTATDKQFSIGNVMKSCLYMVDASA